MSLFRRSMTLCAAAALALSGCGGGESNEAGPKTIEWWHIQNTDPMRPVWDALAKEYQAQHPGVTIKITTLENEAYKAKLTTVTQSGGAPDIFHTWGGGVLQQQAEAGLVKDITQDIAPWSGTLSPIASSSAASPPAPPRADPPHAADGREHLHDHGGKGFARTSA